MSSLAEKIAAKKAALNAPNQTKSSPQADTQTTAKAISSAIATLKSITSDDASLDIKIVPARRSLAEILTAKKAAAQAAQIGTTPAAIVIPSAILDPQADTAKAIETDATRGAETFALSIDLNERQIQARDFAFAGRSFCLIGAAGTGKTTTQRATASAMHESGKLSTTTFKVQGEGTEVSAPSIAFSAYTRRATGNLARAIHKDPALEKIFAFNIMTAHALLEFQPTFFVDPETGKDTMRFVPTRDASNPLTITHLVIEEASMIGLDLWEQIYAALPPDVQIIFIGDINQLQPVFGPSILNYALSSLPVVELTHVYRQAGDSAILENAHRILRGDTELVWNNTDFRAIEGRQKIEVGANKMSAALGQMLPSLIDAGDYDPEQDIILSPFNKGELGTNVLNKYVAQHLGIQRGALVHEVIAGFEKHYLAEGDRVMVNRKDAIIERIVLNGKYLGKTPMAASTKLNRFGMLSGAGGSGLSEDEILAGYENFSLEALEESDRKQQASHIITVRYLDSAHVEEIDSAGALNGQSFQLGYALTVHKSQGCEWRKVFLVLHKCHAAMVHRELFYTAVTRARECFTLIGKRDRTARAIDSPRVKGNSLADKIAYFNANLDLTRDVRILKDADAY